MANWIWSEKQNRLINLDQFMEIFEDGLAILGVQKGPTNTTIHEATDKADLDAKMREICFKVGVNPDNAKPCG